MVGSFPNTINFYDTTVTKSGDETLVLEATVKADVEQFIGLVKANYSDETIGTITAAIPSDDPYFLSKKGRIQGKLAQVDLYDAEDNWFRVLEVRPAISAYTNKIDFIDLVLEKAEAPDASSL